MPNEGESRVSPAEILERIGRLDREREELRIVYRYITGQDIGAGGVEGRNEPPPSLTLDPKPVARRLDIKPDTFFRMSYHQAARVYLEQVGHADRIENIFRALNEGGLTIGGANPMDTLSATLRQATKVFVRVAPGTFGLRSFYPHMKDDKPEKPKKKPKARGARAIKDGSGPKKTAEPPINRRDRAEEQGEGADPNKRGVG